jgi:hypothetical protein
MFYVIGGAAAHPGSKDPVVRFGGPGRSVDAIISRLRSDVLPDCNHLYHPRYAGHQLAGPLPVACTAEAAATIAIS